MWYLAYQVVGHRSKVQFILPDMEIWFLNTLPRVTLLLDLVVAILKAQSVIEDEILL